MRISPRTGAAAVLLVFAVVLYVTEPLFSVIDDEVGFIASAVPPVSVLWQQAVDGEVHAHPPLHNILLHFWLHATGGKLELVRVSSMLIFAAGLWFCCLAAEQIAGSRALLPAALAGVLWPFGFHLGRVQGWYGVSFLLTALLTYAYLRCVKSPNLRNWLLLFFSGALLIYANYYGWVLIACLAAHFAWQHRNRMMLLRMTATLALWLLVFVPLLPGLYLITKYAPSEPVGLKASIVLLLYNAYALFAGESIAPWFLPLSIPIALALAGIVILTFRHSLPQARFLFACVLTLIVVMTIQNIITTKRTMTLGPWLVIPVGVALAATRGTRAGQVLTACSGLVVLLASYGVARPQHYAAPRYIEPWRAVAQREATELRNGALLLVGNPSFCFYLTHELQLPPANPHWKFVGVAPWNVSHPQIMDAAQWLEAGQPTRPVVRLVKGAMREYLKSPNELAERWLDSNCRLANIERAAEDRGYQWKQRFFPKLGQMQWRVEVRVYQCS